MSVYGQETPGSIASEYNMLAFVVRQLIAKIQTITLVKVISCTNAGELALAGTVAVQPLVYQMTGNRVAVDHGVIYDVPYLRVQGGNTAFIIDPAPGDIGICGFCSRDISNVKKARGPATPGSLGMFDYADGLYWGGVLNGLPSQYVRASADGLELHSPVKVRITAPVIEIVATDSIEIDSPATDIGETTTIDGKPFLPHRHSGVESGGDDSGGVV